MKASDWNQRIETLSRITFISVDLGSFYIGRIYPDLLIIVGIIQIFR